LSLEELKATEAHSAGEKCLEDTGKLAQLKDSCFVAIGAATEMEIWGKSSATTGAYRILLFGGKNEYVLVEEDEDVLENMLKLPDELTSERGLAHMKFSIADDETLHTDSISGNIGKLRLWFVIFP
jgi:hypothetical protein